MTTPDRGMLGQMVKTQTPPRAFRPSPVPGTPGKYSVRSGTMVDANQHEELAWSAFLRLCHQAPRGTRVELLRGDTVIASLVPVGTREAE